MERDKLLKELEWARGNVAGIGQTSMPSRKASRLRGVLDAVSLRLASDRLAIESFEKTAGVDAEKMAANEFQSENLQVLFIRAQEEVDKLSIRNQQLKTACGAADLQRDAMMALVMTYRENHPDDFPSTVNEFPDTE